MGGLLGTGEERELSMPPDPDPDPATPLDSLFLRESFFVLFSRAMVWLLASSGAWIWTFGVLVTTSGLSGEDTAGLWSSASKRARFCGMDEGIKEGVVSLWGEFASVVAIAAAGWAFILYFRQAQINYTVISTVSSQLQEQWKLLN